MRIGLESGETVIAQACDRARTAALNFGYQATRIVCRLGLKNRPVSRNRIQAIETVRLNSILASRKKPGTYGK